MVELDEEENKITDTEGVADVEEVDEITSVC